MTRWVFLNERLVPEAEACLHISDASIQRGYGVFDFFRLAGFHPVFLPDHLDRLDASAAGLHLTPPGRLELLQRVQTLIRKNDFPNSGIRIDLTGGCSPDGFHAGTPTLVISQHPVAVPSRQQREAGISLMTFPHQRQLPSIKTTDYLMALWLEPLRTARGFDDVLYHQNGWVTESPRSNFFLITDAETLVTPADNILPGITRKKLMEAVEGRFRVELRPVHLTELKTAKEAFLTSTTKEVLPVSRIDDAPFSSTTISREVHRLFRERHGV